MRHFGSLVFHLEDLSFRSCLAKGRVGIIFRCTHRRSLADCNMAVKVTPLSPQSQNEVDILWALEHPNIISFRGFVQGDKKMYLVTEYAAGGDLLQFLQRQDRLTEELAKHVLKQIAEAVHFMHSSGLAHRDLKLENFMIMEDIETADQLQNARIKLIDMEFSMPSTDDFICQEPVGTKSYFSPQVEMRHYNPLKSDIWCLGICLYVLLTGTIPTPDEVGMPIQLLKNLPPEISPQLRDLMEQLLHPVEKKRPSSQEVLDHDWFEQVQDTPHKIMKRVRKLFGTFSSPPPPPSHLKSQRVCTVW